jgi:hypothetical protein
MFGIPQNQQRYWRWVTRQNTTRRPEIPIDPSDEKVYRKRGRREEERKERKRLGAIHLYRRILEDQH